MVEEPPIHAKRAWLSLVAPGTRYNSPDIRGPGKPLFFVRSYNSLGDKEMAGVLQMVVYQELFPDAPANLFLSTLDKFKNGEPIVLPGALDNL